MNWLERWRLRRAMAKHKRAAELYASAKAYAPDNLTAWGSPEILALRAHAERLRDDVARRLGLLKPGENP